MFESKAIGSQADMAANVDISKVHGGYFASQENIRVFDELGIGRIVEHLPHEMFYVDFGGGQGLLAGPTRQYLEKKGHVVEAIVADGNQMYLNKAGSLGLETVLCNLEDFEKTDVDLITMRAVLHYNPPEKQLLILESARRALNEDGYLVHQVSSGSDANSELRSAVVNIPELGRSGAGRYHWTSINETMELHKQAGFSTTELVGFAPPNSWGPEEQWERFNGERLKKAIASNDTDMISSIEADHRTYLKRANLIIEDFFRRFGEKETGIERLANGSYIIHYQYPILLSKK